MGWGCSKVWIIGHENLKIVSGRQKHNCIKLPSPSSSVVVQEWLCVCWGWGVCAVSAFCSSHSPVVADHRNDLFHDREGCFLPESVFHWHRKRQNSDFYSVFIIFRGCLLPCIFIKQMHTNLPIEGTLSWVHLAPVSLEQGGSSSRKIKAAPL